jgi:hypothetical protein
VQGLTRAGARQVSTRVIQDSLAPAWKEVFRLPFNSKGDTYEALLEDESYPGFGAIHLRLMDWNRLSHSEEIGHAVVPRRLIHKALRPPPLGPSLTRTGVFAPSSQTILWRACL